MSRRNEYLDQGVSDQSGSEDGYDSEVAEVSKSRRDIESNRSRKRRKLSHSSPSSEEELEASTAEVKNRQHSKNQSNADALSTSAVKDKEEDKEDKEDKDQNDTPSHVNDYQIKSAADTISTQLKKSKREKKDKTPGVVYLSSLPPYLKPSALKNLLSHRGFEPITRLFLTPASKHKHSSKKSSRQLYTEGWIEFASKKTAKNCAEALNAQLIGGRKGGFYHDDIWNMKYLRGMAWDELMAGIREERREEEGRRDEERRRIAAETKAFVEGVEQSKRLEGIKRKRKSKAEADDDEKDVQRTWRQHERVDDGAGKTSAGNKPSMDPQVQQVLSKIF